MHIKILVRLKANLTRYSPRLIVGTEGYTIGEYGKWSRASDRFVGVHFPGITTIDVLWDSSEIIDKEYLQEEMENKQKFMKAIKNATDVIIAEGSRGGFKYLTFSLKNEDGMEIHKSIGDRKKAQRLLSIFKDYGITVNKIIIK
ncbi:hypothetical protein CLLI_20370 [Clostridium liquoris]|uniref:Uncharacterized protein n=1 Tax=Clostridium liquoris TaxID=1289519 RepID=A0A2T0B232_9CLOT|nr:hypothetical protein [Clostridium liquoris]PRR77942.1 hypothetical protein CLLI_20370 [Clostridium liquoris]